MSDTAVLAAVASGRPRDRHRWIVFSVMLAGEVMDVLDANIINVAGPALGRELGASPAQLQWAIGGYALAMGDRKSVVSGKSVSVRLDTGGRRILKQKIQYKCFNIRHQTRQST